MKKIVKKILLLIVVSSLITACEDKKEEHKEQKKASDYIRVELSPDNLWNNTNLKITSLSDDLIIKSVSQNRGRCNVKYYGKTQLDIKLSYGKMMLFGGVKYCGNDRMIDFTVSTNQGDFSFSVN